MYSLLASALRRINCLCDEIWQIRQTQIAQGKQIAEILAQVTPPPATHIEIELGTPKPQ